MAKVDVKDFSKDVKSAYEQARERSLEIIGLTAEGYAKKTVPTQHGRLKNSITHAVDGKDVIIGTNVEYAPYLEFGTTRMKPRPFMVPAIERNREWIKNKLAAVVKDPGSAGSAE